LFGICHPPAIWDFTFYFLPSPIGIEIADPFPFGIEKGDDVGGIVSKYRG